MNRNKEKTLQQSYNVIASKLQCDSFKLPNDFIDFLLAKLILM